MVAHAEQLPECAERFATLEGWAESYKGHEEESKDVRDKVVRHEQIIENLANIRNLFWGNIIVFLLALGTWLVSWGAMMNRVDNLESYTKFIMEHSYGVQDFEKGAFPNKAR